MGFCDLKPLTNDIMDFSRVQGWLGCLSILGSVRHCSSKAVCSQRRITSLFLQPGSNVPVSEMTYIVSGGTLNSTLLTYLQKAALLYWFSLSSADRKTARMVLSLSKDNLVYILYTKKQISSVSLNTEITTCYRNMPVNLVNNVLSCWFSVSSFSTVSHSSAVSVVPGVRVSNCDPHLCINCSRRFWSLEIFDPWCRKCKIRAFTDSGTAVSPWNPPANCLLYRHSSKLWCACFTKFLKLGSRVRFSSCSCDQ